MDGAHSGGTNRRGGQADPLRAELERRLQLLADHGQRADPKDITAAVESIMATVEGDLSAVNLKLYAEIEALGRYIESAKAEIAEVRPDEIRDQHLPTATDELEAIVGATEQATNQILEAVESIEEVAGEVDEAKSEKITGAVTQVYEACNFQDITGQRITKVVTALQEIERKVDALLAAFGEEMARNQIKRRQAEAASKDDEKSLMNGPASPNEAVSQEDIDALLASFD
ncbi:protein phosphatase CheZ [Ferruginivarius sediminum]|jgi:chemotaxis protein CheZ|uniref:Chemotaxis protein CheZ n=1 Tax=Ferruginivarius sediminum TaxID=2661937 RepID=A0A369TB92_9PROT|nr:protein phosphatase CheZ [Ferruginivarius sediminum]RDD62579.1 chemotaxis protein CheZ [Ferruginivarius sediminum]